MSVQNYFHSIPILYIANLASLISCLRHKRFDSNYSFIIFFLHIINEPSKLFPVLKLQTNLEQTAAFCAELNLPHQLVAMHGLIA